MTRTVTVIYDGQVLRPQEPVDLEPNVTYRVTIEDDPAQAAEEQYPLAKFARFAIETGIPDLAEQHDHYLYGVPKR
jgi:predicted DNA-binding antitoxin AbrB/MazE fold protein